LPHLNADDRRGAAALIDLNIRVDAGCWDDPAVDWLAFDAVVVRSTWDYHHRVSEFHAWIDRLDAAGVRLWNPPHVLRWNTDKRYLATVSHPQLSPPATEMLRRGSPVDLRALLEARGWDEAVLKPAISADGFSTERTSREDAMASQSILDAMLSRGDVVLQRLVPEIRSNGEISMMFFGSAFSHAVSKRPQAGEFRVQERLGGRITRIDPPEDLVGYASALLDLHAPGCLYARVDAVIAADRYVLMEIELVEPTLYFQHDPSAAGAFALAVRRIA
jgi:glutathione synthase/RimK-type ligase-like ATP-grasp enzyme